MVVEGLNAGGVKAFEKVNNGRGLEGSRPDVKTGFLS